MITLLQGRESHGFVSYLEEKKTLSPKDIFDQRNVYVSTSEEQLINSFIFLLQVHSSFLRPSTVVATNVMVYNDIKRKIRIYDFYLSVFFPFNNF